MQENDQKKRPIHSDHPETKSSLTRRLGVALVVAFTLSAAGSVVGFPIQSTGELLEPETKELDLLGWPENIEPSRVLLTFHDGIPEVMPDYVVALGGEVVMEIPELDFVVVSIDPELSGRLIAWAQADPLVDQAEYDGYFYTQYTPNDMFYAGQWGLAATSLPDAWDITLGSHDVDIHIMDTGIDFTHLDLIDNICSLGRDSVTLGLGPGMESGFHGTHVAGIAAAKINNTIGIAGASQSCITPVRVLAAETGLWSWLVNGINWSTANGADIISMSLGGTGAPSSLSRAINDAYDDGILLVAAAGNDGCSGSPPNNVGQPANHPNVIAVAALSSPTARASYSSCGTEVEISAPGSSISSTMPGNLYATLSGTSMAAPLVSGIAALVWDVNPSLTNVEVRCILSATADPLSATWTGSGLINAHEAVLRAPSPSSVNC